MLTTIFGEAFLQIKTPNPQGIESLVAPDVSGYPFGWATSSFSVGKLDV
ncbi:MAG: hypothetical protein INQ03_02610 [Candidatus Heimdallarchaeota archaeon]|nr:hypothetical protein [Candidatus Heimdallarchaeota archaeon]